MLLFLLLLFFKVENPATGLHRVVFAGFFFIASFWQVLFLTREAKAASKGGEMKGASCIVILLYTGMLWCVLARTRNVTRILGAYTCEDCFHVCAKQKMRLLTLESYEKSTLLTLTPAASGDRWYVGGVYDAGEKKFRWTEGEMKRAGGGRGVLFSDDSKGCFGSNVDYCMWDSQTPVTLNQALCVAVDKNYAWYEYKVTDTNDGCICDNFVTLTMSPTASTQTRSEVGTRSKTVVATRTHTHFATESFTTITPPPTDTMTITSPSVSVSSTFVGTPTLSLVQTDSPSFSSSFSPSQTSSTSDSETTSDSLSCTGTPTISETSSISLSLTPSPTVSQTFTVTQSFSLTGTTTDTMSQTLTESNSFSISQTKTSTRTLSNTLTFTTSATLSLITYTLILTDTNSWTASASIQPSETLSVSNTLTFSASLSTSAEVYCALTPASRCITLSVCRITDEGACVSTQCGIMQSEELCLVSGCAWNINECRDASPCSTIVLPDECDLTVSCQWNYTSHICGAYRTSCNEIEGKDICLSENCTWSDKVLPHCFRPIHSGPLCRLLPQRERRYDLLCKAHFCIWIEEQSMCESWGASCRDLPPSPTTCGLLEHCVYSSKSPQCVDISSTPVDRSVIWGAYFPQEVLVNETFTVHVFGAPLDTTSGMLFADAMECPKKSAFSPSQNGCNVTYYYDSYRKASVGVGHCKTSRGKFFLCAMTADGTILGPFGNLTVRDIAPNVYDCFSSPTYINDTFSITFVGHNFSTFGGKAAFIKSSSQCPPANSTLYLPVARQTATDVVARNTLVAPGNYTVCFRNEGGASKCPKTIEVATYPPWVNISHLYSTINSSMLISAVNKISCSGMQGINDTHGLYANPVRGLLQYGDGKGVYAGGEVCAFGVFPKATESNTTTALITFAFQSLSLDEGDSVYILVPKNVTGYVDCTFLLEKADCLNSGCTWDGACVVSPSTSTCLKNFTSFTVVRVIGASEYGRNPSLEVYLPSSGVIAVVCTTLGSKSSTGVIIEYTAHATGCPNDCQDSQDSLRGLCELTTRGYRCKCNAGFTGDDCSHTAVCHGTGAAAEKVKRSAFSDTFVSDGNPCAIVLESVAPSGILGPVGIGIALSNIRTSAALTSLDCLQWFIEIKVNSHNGPSIVKICPATIEADASGEFARFVNENSSSVYLLYSMNKNDQFRINITYVSLTCPGNPDETGIASSKDQICSGRGACVSKDYTLSERLATTLKECLCSGRFAASSVGGTCDTCGLGYQKNKFPECPPDFYCVNSCSSQGKCVVQTGCSCEKGTYGLGCQLVDDGERYGRTELKHRIPLNQVGGNVMSIGYIDRTVLPCSLAGEIPCTPIRRDKGKLMYSSPANFNFSSLPARRELDTNVTLNTSIDYGFRFNAHAANGDYPDYVRTDNVTGRLSYGSEFTVTGWVKTTSSVNGFFFALVDSAFYSDGRSPVLERALLDVRSRSTPLAQIRLSKETLNIYFGVHLDGPNRRVNIIGTDPTTPRPPRKKESWIYVRHHRIGGNLFDGVWHHLAVKVFKSDTWLEAQIFVDGDTRLNSNYLQCLPFLPIQDVGLKVHLSNDSAIVFNASGASTIWGYHLDASLDELAIFEGVLSTISVQKIGGVGGVLIALAAPKAMLGVTAVGFAASVALFWWFSRDPTPQEGEAQDEENGVEDALLAEAGLLLEDDERPTIVAEGTALHATSEGPNPLLLTTGPKEMKLQEDFRPLGPEASDVSPRIEDITPQPQEAPRDSTHLAPHVSPTKRRKSSAVSYDSNQAAVDVIVSDIDRMHILLVMKILQRIDPTKKQSAAMKKRLQALAAAKEGGGGGDAGADGGLEQEGGPTIITIFIETLQILGQLIASMGMSPLFKSSFGWIAYVVTLNFISLTPGAFAIIFYVLMVLAFLAMLWFVGLLLVSKHTPPKDMVESFQQQVASMKEQIKKGEQVKKKRTAAETISWIALMILSFLYMPVTQLATAVVFCHVSVLCLFDCYHEKAHNNLVVAGVITLIGIPLFVPLLFLWIVRRARKQFNDYIAAEDTSKEHKARVARHWTTFVAAVPSPLSGLYEKFRYEFGYFQALLFVYKALLSVLLVCLTQYTTAQLICVVLLQNFICLILGAAQPFILNLLNRIMFCAHMYLLLMIGILQCTQILTEAAEVGMAMLILTIVYMVIIVIVLVIVVVLIVRKKAEKRKQAELEAQFAAEQRRSTLCAALDGTILNHGGDAPNPDLTRETLSLHDEEVNGNSTSKIPDNAVGTGEKGSVPAVLSSEKETLWDVESKDEMEEMVELRSVGSQEGPS